MKAGVTIWRGRVLLLRVGRHCSELTYFSPSRCRIVNISFELQGIMRLGLDTGVPVIFGVLTVLTEEQARARAGLVPGKHNHGTEWAQTALQMAAHRATHQP